MSLIEAGFLIAVCIGFIGFAVLLAWADYQTSHIKWKAIPLGSSKTFHYTN